MDIYTAVNADGNTQIKGWEYLIPYRAPILVETVRERREIIVDPPPGLLEL